MDTKKFVNLSFIYAIAAMVGGVFYREFTRMNGFEGKTSLAFAHLHLFVLGTVIFLIMALFEQQFGITKSKYFKLFFIIYNIGLPLMVVMFLVRGIMQVVGYDGGAMISGIAGLTHITLGTGIVFMFLMLRESMSLKTIKAKK